MTYTRPARNAAVDSLIGSVAKRYGWDFEDVVGYNRSPSLTRCRQLAMLVVRESTDLSLPAIAVHFGGRDHTTVLHGCRKAAERVHSNPRLEAEYRALLEGKPSVCPTCGRAA